MLSVVCSSCWEWTAAPCSLHNPCTTCRALLDHLWQSSSSFETKSSLERFLFPAALPYTFNACYDTTSTYWQAENTPSSKWKHLKVNRRNLMMFCRSSWSSVASALWNDCPKQRMKWKQAVIAPWWLPLLIIFSVDDSQQRFQLNRLLWCVLEDNSGCADTVRDWKISWQN